MREVMASRELRHGYQVAYSLRMVSEIAARYGASEVMEDMLYPRCMVDAFFVHVRLLAEFLGRDTKGLDFGPAAFVTTWEPPESAAVNRLDEYWRMASKYVVHFGHERVPEDVEDLAAFDVSAAALLRMSSDVLEVFEAFVVAVEAEPADGDVFALGIRARMLRNELDECRRLLVD